MRWLALVLALVPGMAGAEEWRMLDGQGITAALSARVVQYTGGQRQDFFADGRTVYESGGSPSWGQWRVEGDRYCSVWPPSDRWSCYEVASKGLEIRFQDGGEATVGQYVDLN